MTSLRGTVAKLFSRMASDVPGAPEAEFTFAPETVEETASILDFASEHGLVVVPWGGGTHQSIGSAVSPDIVVGTNRLQGIDWRPDDLTVVVGAGVPVATLEATLAERGQTAVLPEHPGEATVGGVVAAGISGYRRLRYGPTRERMLEVVVATGDGRVVRGGGQVVKNVSGYDLPRLFTGSFGSLGIITRVCLKLWPRGEAVATVRVPSLEAAGKAYRPLAILETGHGISVYLAGTSAEVEAQASDLGGEVVPQLDWPVSPTGEVIVSIRVPPSLTAAAVERAGWADAFAASHGVGEVVAAGPVDRQVLVDLRAWAEASGGAMVVFRAPADLGIDPWGSPPASLELQRRIKGAFDPLGVMVPGRLAGGL